jgi:hypothetical protein
MRARLQKQPRFCFDLMRIPIVSSNAHRSAKLLWIAFIMTRTPAQCRFVGERSGALMSSPCDTSDYAKLLQDYRELTEGVRMVRRAAERACRAGVLPSIDDGAATPLQECEAVARAIYQSVATPDIRVGRRSLAGVIPGNPSK